MYQETAKLRTKSRIFIGAKTACKCVERLIAQSQWFQFEPLPDGEYEITIKEEIEHMLYPVLERA